MYNVSNDTGDIQFMVLYKKIGYKAERGNYLAPSKEDLLRMLNKAENVSVNTCELLVIHQHLPDGTVLEVLSHDQIPRNSTSVVTELRPTGKIHPKTGKPYVKAYTPEDARIMAVVGALLNKAGEAENSKPKKKKDKKFRPGRVTVAFNYHAYPARSGNYVED